MEVGGMESNQGGKRPSGERHDWEPMKVADVGDLVQKVGGGAAKPISSPFGDPGEPRKNEPTSG